MVGFNTKVRFSHPLFGAREIECKPIDLASISIGRGTLTVTPDIGVPVEMLLTESETQELHEALVLVQTHHDAVAKLVARFQEDHK